MKIAIVGAGIIGVTTAYELAADGHEVRFSSAAAPPPKKPALPMPGWSRPATSRHGRRPACRAKVLGYLFSRHAPVKLGCPGASELAWMWRWWRACGLETYLANRARMQRLAFYSRERLHQLTAGTAAGIRPQRRLHGAAALRKRPRAHTPRPAGAARRGGEVPRDRPGRGAQGRTRAEPGHRLCRRHPPAGRRSRQLPAVCAAAEGRSPPAGRWSSSSTPTWPASRQTRSRP
jgi:hypothetical protein